jgi:drug/metabolite transporter (DMT)-like permease
MWIFILSALIAESSLALYPIFVKNINLPIFVQMWSRFFSYVAISAAFIDYDFVAKNLVSSRGLVLCAITTIHIYFSYRGFQLLESGVAYTLFYLYPLMILLMAGENINPIMLFSLLGVYLLAGGGGAGAATPSAEGVAMILGAAATEAAIYFAVRGLKTRNHWNHLFISYFAGAVLFSAGLMWGGGGSGSAAADAKRPLVWASLGINALIGLFGYLLRFFAISNLPASIYAPLSYFGIFMSYLYGVLINGDKITAAKVAGTIMILIPNVGRGALPPSQDVHPRFARMFSPPAKTPPPSLARTLL